MSYGNISCETPIKARKVQLVMEISTLKYNWRDTALFINPLEDGDSQKIQRNSNWIQREIRGKNRRHYRGYKFDWASWYQDRKSVV